MNPVHNVRITITLFLIYLLRPVPSDVQLFFDCKTDLELEWIRRNAIG